MDEMAIGRKEIVKLLRVASWRTIQEWKAKDAGFRRLFKVHPVTRKPMVFAKEVIQWMIEYNK